MRQKTIRPVENSTRFINYLIDSLVFIFIIFLHAMILDAGLGIVLEGGFELFPLYLVVLVVL
ncbi:hypothetical protein TMP248_380005 [Tenacibaculum maritimum]|uniref:hypothetical protein n=1 Tax=Tenacibaculum maritimum TaxID=107401 RepID=UPI0012E58C5E|nr:hypothetical protein [Tenacibaculum maritimum]CAA0211060.1 hypothetical protein NACSLCCMFF_340002 [Tenacibaculum maritimum]CAA0227258.1 hypothetical protein TMP248_380005 [Tenacibaculum maritimum]